MDQPAPEFLSSYHRCPDRSLPSASTDDCTATIDWWSPKLRYWTRCISRPGSASTRLVCPATAGPDGTHSRPTPLPRVSAQLRLMSNGTVLNVWTRPKVLLAGLVQSTWKSYMSMPSDAPPWLAESREIRKWL